MTIEAKPVVKNKYWIVEQDGEKVATIQTSVDGVVLVEGDRRQKYPSIKVLGTAHNIKFVHNKPQKSQNNSVYDYPSKNRPYNAIFDLKLRLPLYTNSRKSKSYFCAGYYLVKYGSEWTTEFCPKKIILTRNPYLGPFKSEQCMLESLSSLSTHK